MHPPRSFGKRSNKPSRISTPRNSAGDCVDGEEVLRADVLAPAEVVGDRHGVVVERAVEQTPAAADVQDEGHVCSLSVSQNPSRSGCVGARSPAAVDGTIDRRAAVVDRLGCEQRRPRAGSTSGTNATG